MAIIVETVSNVNKQITPDVFVEKAPATSNHPSIAPLGFHAFNAGDPIGNSVFVDERKLPYSSHWMFNSRYGQPRGINVFELRTFAKSSWVQMVTTTIKNQISTIEWDLPNKDKEDRGTYDEEKKLIKEFTDRMNANGEDFNDNITPMLNDWLEIDAGAIVKIFSKESYAEQEVQLVDEQGINQGTKTLNLLKPFGERELEETMFVDGATFTVQYDRYRRLQAYYQYSWRSPMGAPIPFEPDEVAYFKSNTRTWDAYGFSPLQSIQQVVELLIQSTRWNKDFFINNAIPDALIGLPQLDDKQIARFNEEWKMKFKGRAHKMAMVNTDVAYQSLVSSARDMEWLDGQKWFMHLVFGVYGVSPVEAGFHENVNQGNQSGQERITVKNAIKPYLARIEKFMNNNLIPELLQKLPSEIPFEFKYFPHDHVQEQIEFEQSTKELELGALTINEYRAEKGLDPVEWGDEPREQAPATQVNVGENGKGEGRPAQRQEQDVKGKAYIDSLQKHLRGIESGTH